MSASLLVLAGLLLAPAPAPKQPTLPVRMLSLPCDPSHVRIKGKQLFISGFHAQKVAVVAADGKEPAKVLLLDAYEHYHQGRNGGEIREIRRAAGGDLVLASGKIFVGQIFQGSLLVVDQQTFTPVKRLPLGGEGDLTATRDGKTVFFASNKKEEFHIIDTKTYEHRTIPYPKGGRGIGCIALSPDEKRLYLGIQRGGRMPDGKQLSGGNCVLAGFDLVNQTYAGTVFLAQQLVDGSGDDATPASFAFSADGERLYIGMFQSRAGVQVVDLKKMELLANISFPSRHQQPIFPWTDPVSVAVFDRWLLVAVRHNQELAAVDLATHKIVARFTHTEAVDLERVMVHGKQVYLYGGSSRISIVEGVDLANLLHSVQRDKMGPVQVTLIKR
jgi:hypothetical protein